MKPDILHNFISPVTGRLLCNPNYILIGNRKGIATPSPILIDIGLKIINLRLDLNNISSANFVIGSPNLQLPNAQVLSNKPNGYLYNDEGIVSTVGTIPIGDFNLALSNIWIGDTNNRPIASPTIELNNLPNLTAGNMWLGNILGHPIEVIAPPGPQGPAGPPGPRGPQGVQGPTGLSYLDVLFAIFEALLKKLLGDNLLSNTIQFLTKETIKALFQIWLNSLKAALVGATGQSGARGVVGATGLVGLVGNAGKSAANTLIIKNVNMNLSRNRIFNLAQSPSWDYDAITAKFFYDLLNNNVIIKWKQNIWTSMAMSTITVEGLNPALNILGDTQQFNYNQPLSTFQLTNIFIPTSLISSQTNYEVRNNLLSGFRWVHLTSNTDTYGTFKLQSFVNASSTGSDLISFSSSGINLNSQIITNGTWNGNTIGVGYGGTGLNSTTINQILYSSANNVIAGLATANNGVLVTSSGGVPSISSTLPSAVQGNITSVGTIGTGIWNGTAITVAYGGTGRASATAYSVICGGTTSTGALQSVASVGTSGQVLTSQGASALPIWANAGTGTVTSITAGTGLSGGTITTSGTIAIANTAVTAGSYTYGSFTVNAQGQLTAASSGTAPVTSVSGGTGITVTGTTTPTIAVNSSVVTAVGSGGAATCGLDSLVSGTATISTSAIETTSIVNITRNSGTGTPSFTNAGELNVGSIVAGTSFIVSSSNVLDSSGFSWQIVNPV